MIIVYSYFPNAHTNKYEYTCSLPLSLFFFIQIVAYLLYYTLPFSLTVYIGESPILEMENFSIFKAE